MIEKPPIILAISLVALAAIIATPFANAGTVSTASDCKPVFAHTEYKWVPNVSSAGPTMWTLDNAPANTQRSFLWKGQNVDYHRDGTKSQFIDSVTCAVSAPIFSVNVDTCSVTVPYTPGIDTVLYGVNGHTETAITSDVTVTGSNDGAPGTATQFWIGYTPQPGYVISNPGAAPWHIDFYNGDDVRDCISTATGDVTWDFQGSITGTVKFDAKATGGSLHYTNSNGQELDGVVTSYRQIDARTAVFAGTITGGSPDYTEYHPGDDYFFAKVVDGGTPGSNGDQIAVLANAGFDPTLGANQDYNMADGYGIVTSGNLVVN